MKALALCFLLMFVMISCKNEAKNSSESDDNAIENTEIDEGNKENQTSNSNGTNNTSEYSNESPDTTSEEKSASGPIANGTYIKIDEDDPDCSCYCIEVVTSGQIQLCLKDEEMYINTRFVKENGVIQVYYVSEAAKNIKNDLPWNEFDTNTPIAEIISIEKGIELDWKGFSINGELAVDYAIYGKKSLEGNYRKQ